MSSNEFETYAIHINHDEYQFRGGSSTLNEVIKSLYTIMETDENLSLKFRIIHDCNDIRGAIIILNYDKYCNQYPNILKTKDENLRLEFIKRCKQVKLGDNATKHMTCGDYKTDKLCFIQEMIENNDLFVDKYKVTIN